MNDNDQELMVSLLGEADEISKNLSIMSCVEGVVLMGGAARGYVDAFSDLDIAIFCHLPCENIRVGEQLHRGIDLDTMILDVDYSKSAKWSHAQRQAFSEGKILFDRDGKVKLIIETKLRYTDEERLLDVLNIIMNLNWRGFRGRNVRIPKDYQSSVPFDLMSRRNCLACSHVNINESIDILIQLLYVYNRSFIPDPKWRFKNLTLLRWLPKNFDGRIKDALKCERLDSNELTRRSEVLNELLDELLQRIDLEKFVPDEGYRYFLEHSSEYDPRQ